MKQARELIFDAAYDPLNRLTAFRRGTLSSSGNNGTTLDTVTTAVATNSWSLDALGNSTNTGGTSRSFNSKNQITAISGLTTPTYDHDGNMTRDQAGDTYRYDAWNRLLAAFLPNNPYYPNEAYTYDADNRRPGLNICQGSITTSYYSSQWQDLEDDVVTPGQCGPTTTKSTYVWSESYIDDLVARDTGSSRVYAQQDANHDVTSLVNTSGTVLERFAYDPYGARTVLSASWSATSDSYAWVYGFQGGRLDPLTGLVNFRNRDLNPVTGTWMEEDPDGYVQGANLYQADSSNPTSQADPFGLTSDQFNGLAGVRWNREQGYAEIGFSISRVPDFLNYFFGISDCDRDNPNFTRWVPIQSLPREYASIQGLINLNRQVTVKTTDQEAPAIWSAFSLEVARNSMLQQGIVAAKNAVGSTGLGPTGNGAVMVAGMSTLGAVVRVLNEAADTGATGGGDCPGKGVPQRGIGGSGWRGDAKWRTAVKSVTDAGHNATLDAADLGAGTRPTLQEARDLVNESGGTIVREDIAGHAPGGVSTHLDPHINFTTGAGNRATIYIQPPG